MKLSAVLFAVSLACAELASRSGANSPRRLSFEKIAGYSPGSQVTDHCAIDLDQAAIELQLAIQTSGSFDRARAIYNEGGNSNSYAQITLLDGLRSTLPKGESIFGQSVDGSMVMGEAYQDYEVGSSVIKVRYATSDLQESYVDCQVGALPEVNLRGCFAAEGGLTIGGTDYPYTYDPNKDNKNGRTIAGFSTSAGYKMRTGCSGCPYQDFMYFYNYYGVDDYAHQWAEAAFGGRDTQFMRGNADFSAYDLIGRAEAIKEGTVILHIFMYVIRELEDALDDCEQGCVNCNDDSVHAWDKGVCYYTGSLEGRDGLSNGELLHQLADKRCTNFKTCGSEGTDLYGTARLNLDVFNQFAVGQFHLLRGNCAEARSAAKGIIAKMYVPMIQGALRYAYRVDGLQGGEKEKAKAAVYAAALLPRVHAVSPDAARTVYDNLRVGATSTDFQAVKNALESIYVDIGVSCTDVGGLWNGAEEKYYSDAEPCIEIEQPASTLPGEYNSATSPPISGTTPTGMPSLPTNLVLQKPTNSPSLLTTTSRPPNSTIAEYPLASPSMPTASSGNYNSTTNERPTNGTVILASKVPSPSTLSPVTSPVSALELSMAPSDDASVDLDNNSVGKAGGTFFVASVLACFVFSYQT